MVRANGSIPAPRRPSTSSGRVSGIFGISLGDSLSLSEFGAFTFEDELFSQLQFFRHGARHQDLGTSPNLGRTAPMCTPQQQRSAAGAQQQRCGLSGWAVTHMGQGRLVFRWQLLGPPWRPPPFVLTKVRGEVRGRVRWRKIFGGWGAHGMALGSGVWGACLRGALSGSACFGLLSIK